MLKLILIVLYLITCAKSQTCFTHRIELTDGYQASSERRAVDHVVVLAALAGKRFAGTVFNYEPDNLNMCARQQLITATPNDPANIFASMFHWSWSCSIPLPNDNGFSYFNGYNSRWEVVVNDWKTRYGSIGHSITEDDGLHPGNSVLAMVAGSLIQHIIPGFSLSGVQVTRQKLLDILGDSSRIFLIEKGTSHPSFAKYLEVNPQAGYNPSDLIDAYNAGMAAFNRVKPSSYNQIPNDCCLNVQECFATPTSPTSPTPKPTPVVTTPTAPTAPTAPTLTTAPTIGVDAGAEPWLLVVIVLGGIVAIGFGIYFISKTF